MGTVFVCSFIGVQLVLDGLFKRYKQRPKYNSILLHIITCFDKAFDQNRYGITD